MDRNIAVVGAGYWGRNLVRVFDQLGALAAVCDSREEARQAIPARSGDAVRFTADFDEILSDPAIRAVAIATPAVEHFRMARRSLEAGRDVFVEKPLALDSGEGEELIKLAREQERVLMVGHILHYHPAIVRLRELVNSGALGKILYLYSNRLNFGKIRTEENILWSFAPHDISVMLALLGEEPAEIACSGADYLQPGIYDTTMTSFAFRSGARAHIYVSWLHPFKEQKLVVIGSEKMAVFDDTAGEKLVLFPHRVNWVNRVPSAEKAAAEPVPLETREPLLAEAEHFCRCVSARETPFTDGREGLRVLKVLDACQRSLAGKPSPAPRAKPDGCFVHPTACIDEGVTIGAGTKIWHFSHLMSGTRLGRNCNLGQNVVAGPDVTIGNNVKIQNNVSVYRGVTLEDDVFCGPSMVFTNVINPRSGINRMGELRPTLVRRGATIGANATIVCGRTIGCYAFVGAGAVVTRDVPDYALVLGNPARAGGWVCACGVRLPAAAGAEKPGPGEASCDACGRRYRLDGETCRPC